MDFVARAKALFNNRAAVGLIVVPLAAAVPAFGQGSSTLPTGDFGCVAFQGNGASGSCTSGSTVSQLAPLNGIAGVKFYGPSSGSYSFSNFSSSGSSAELIFDTIGTLGGSSVSGGTIIPLLYDFTINGTSSLPTDKTSTGALTGGSFTGWDLEYEIFENESQVAFLSVPSPGSNFTGLQSGSANLTLTTTLASGSTVQVDVGLFIDATAGETVNVSIPSSSFDVNNTSATPEPSTEALAGLSLALAAGYLLVRRRNGFVLVKDQAKS